MIETVAVRNRVLAQLLEHDPELRQYVQLMEVGDGYAMRQQMTYFPVTAVLALVTPDLVDAVLVRPGECTWAEPYSALLQVRLPGYLYTVSSGLLHVAAFRHVLTSEAARLHCRAIENLSQLATQSCSRSIARYLLGFGLDDLPLTQQTVANAVDLRRETVTDALARFERQGWVQCSRGRVVIQARSALQNYAVGDLELAAA